MTQTAVLEGEYRRIATVNPGTPEGSAELERIIAESTVDLRRGPRQTIQLRDPRYKAALARSVQLVEATRRGADPYHFKRALAQPEFHQHLFDMFSIGAEKRYLETRVQRGDLSDLRENLTTSDFPNLFGDTLNRELLGTYESWPLSWPNYVRRGSAKDFRPVRPIALDGLDGRWTLADPPAGDRTPEMAPPHEHDDLTETPYSYSVDVYQRSFQLNWRMLINDDLGAFTNLAPRLAMGAHRAEEFLVTGLYANSTGPLNTLYTTGNHNIINTTNGAVVTNPPLSIAGLQDAMTVLLRHVNPVTGEPIYIDAVELVIPPALRVIANNILNALTLRMGGYTAGASGGGGTMEQQLETVNWMRQQVRINVNPYLPTVDTTHGNTAWYLFANPNSGRPALELGFLRGYETPSLWQKAPDMMRMGGAIDPMMGSFDSGSIEYKGLAIFGGVAISPLMTVASNGSGS